MPAPPPPLDLSAQFGRYATFVAPQDAAVQVLDPGERLGGPPPRRRRRALRFMLVLALAGAGTSIWLERRDELSILLAQAIARVDEFKTAQQREPARDTDKPAEPLPVDDKDVASLPVVGEAREPVAVGMPDTAPGAPPADPDAGKEETVPDRLPPVTADPADALLQKALASGLHPGLSRALLEKLTPEDFRAAAGAIAEMMSKGAASPPIVRPRRREAGRAQFRIRLVAGAPTACLRYVVQIAKDGWETTARPMERCKAGMAMKPT